MEQPTFPAKLGQAEGTDQELPPVDLLAAVGAAPLPELWCKFSGSVFTALPVQSVAWPATALVIVVLVR